MAWIRDKFYALEAKERLQLIFIIALSVIALYGYSAAVMWEHMFEAEKLANRKANRIETRIGKLPDTDIDASLTPETLENHQERLISIEQQLINFSENLMPLDDPEPREATKLALSRIAANQGIDIISLRATNTDIVPIPEKLNGEALRNLLTKRPVFRVICKGNYLNFVRFSEQLKTLPYQSFIRHLSMLPDEQGLLTIQFELQM